MNRSWRPHVNISTVLEAMPLWLLLIVWLGFAAVSPQFAELENLRAIVEYASSSALVAIGMTFVLLTGGIDLSVGAVMLVGGATAGKLLLGGSSVAVAVMAMLLIGLAWGTVNGLLITSLKMVPFVVTLAMLFVGRGIGLWISQTKPMNLPDSYRMLATSQCLQLPMPVWLLLLGALCAQGMLSRTPLGRQVYAMGNNLEAAQKAGIPIRRNQLLMYAFCGLFASVGGAITLSQLNAVSPTLGASRELDAIAAAVLGGVSLFGGRGSALGAALGAILIQTIQNGLTNVDSDPRLDVSIDPYFYPLITGGIIFAAVLMDSARRTWVDRANRRWVRPLDMRM